ncbi:ThuA domain-containing protein [Georgenia sp. SUBG003]|uniref:ThuA domain-containing protein n=1 Tax=Georgenia sp. SUBG003 TaxID=1497974 RepID=UPI0006938BDA
MSRDRRPGEHRLALTRRRRALALLSGGTLAVTLAVPAATAPAGAAPEPAEEDGAGTKVLLFHGEPDAQDDPVVVAAEALTEIGAANDLTVEATADPAVFTAGSLDDYRSVVFLSALETELSASQEGALKDFVNDGGGFLGIRDAARVQERSDWFTGLIGTRPVGALPDAAEVAEVTASANNPPNEIAEKLIDGDPGTKWLAFNPTATITYRLTEPVTVNRYALTSANDASGRDPQNWTLKGSTDGETWTDLDTRADEDFPDRFQTRDFEFENSTAYEYFQLDITKNAGDDLTQLADLDLFAADATTEPEPEIEVQETIVDVPDRQHPATKDLPLNWTRSDRWLNWAPNPVGTVHTVAQIRENLYDAGEGANGAFHPISWCRDYDGGRSFYTGMGGTAESYSDETFRTHLAGALQWTAGTVRGDCQATIGENYEIERLTARNAQGQLDQIGEPHGLTVAPDGTVFYVGKAACPSGPVASWEDPEVGLGCGTIHQWDPESGEVTLLTTLDVMGNRGSGSELVKNEEGLLGIVPDPDFAENNWIYVYWMPHESVDRDKRVGQRTVSRFTYDPAGPSIDQSTRVDLLQWETQVHSCCHAGGGMAFDDEGNLYIGSGDSNSSGGSQGYSGNNWTQEYAGISFQDARRTSGNTNDLNGKILRIHPEDDGTYTVPEGNLFPESEDPGDKTRPEIYVMGVRNISRLQIDADTDWLTAGWVGPDAGSPNPELGPAKYETATIITSAGNQGWPYCMGNRQPYRDRSNEDASVLTGWYDCDNLKNTSPRNTGLVDLPPARDNMIWYSPGGGGPVFPLGEDGVPTYDDAEATYTQPWYRGGGQAVMSGPTYRTSQVDPDSDVAWPEYWEGKWFIGDQSNGNNRVAVTVDPANVEKQGPPAFAEDMRSIVRAGNGEDELQSWMDAKFGPDGALYLLDYAGGFFSLDPNQKLLRVTYQGGPATPTASATATSLHDRPLTVAFTGERSGGVSYAWDFGDGSTSSEANPRHTYAKVGTYTATLTVTYADGETATTTTEVKIACVSPDARDTVWIGDTDTGVKNHDLGGCTINDLIDDEGQWEDHGDFVDHVGDVVDHLKKDGVISGKDKGRLTSAAARSDVGKKGYSGYETIFDGTAESLEGWTQAPGGHFELTDEGNLASRGGLGMLWYSAQEFDDFSLKLQFRDVSEGSAYANSGVFIRFPDPRTPADELPECATGQDSQAWIAIYCGQEIQIYDGPTGEPQKTGSVYNFDPVGLEDAGVTPKGEWNDYEIRVVDQHYTIIRNGEVINEFDNVPGISSSRQGDPPTDLRQFASGFVGLQNHGNNDLIEFRNIQVRDL